MLELTETIEIKGLFVSRVKGVLLIFYQGRYFEIPKDQIVYYHCTCVEDKLTVTVSRDFANTIGIRF